MKSGLVVLDKPAGMTSNDCLTRLKRILGRSDIGHGGTLDKFATGLLPVFVGEGLKLSRFFLEEHPDLDPYWKTYLGKVVLGTTTNTLDPEGEFSESQDLSKNKELWTLDFFYQLVESSFKEKYFQTPPLFSAKKINGKRASDYARVGQTPEVKPRQVILKNFRAKEINWIQQTSDVEVPVLSFELTVSKGFYVRSFARDLAKVVNTVGYISELRRTEVRPFCLSQAFTLDHFEKIEGAWENHLISLSEAASFLPRLDFRQDEIDEVSSGRFSRAYVRIVGMDLKPGSYCAWNASQNVPFALFKIHPDQKVEYLRRFH